MFNFLKRKQTTQKPPDQEHKIRPDSRTSTEPAEIIRPVDFSRPVTDEEREVVSAVTSAILAGDKADSVFRVKSVTGIDCDKEAAAVVAAAVMSSDHSDTIFRLKSITELK